MIKSNAGRARARICLLALALAMAGSLLASPSIARFVSVNSGTTEVLTSIAFVNHSTAFVAGDNGVVLKTINGGQTWAAIPTGTSESFKKVIPIDSDSAFLLADGTGGGFYAAPKLKKITGSVYSTFYDFSPTFEGIVSVYVNGQTMYVYGAGQNVTFAKSNDGGTTWTYSNVIAPSVEVVITSGQFQDDSNGYLSIFNIDLANQKAYNKIYKTTDGATSWDKIYESQIIADTSESTSIFLHMIFAIDSFGSNSIWAAKLLSGLSYTNNGGATWNDTSIGASNTFMVTSVKGINDRIGFIAGGTGIGGVPHGIDMTVDGGASFENIVLGNYLAMDGVVNPTNVICVGAMGAISIIDPPRIQTISKNQFKQGISEAVTINGAGFDRSYLSFSDPSISAESVSIVSSTELRATLNVYPSAAIGPVDVTIYNIDTSSSTEVGLFSVISGEANMSISSIVPGSAWPSEEIHIAINGSNFPIRFEAGSVSFNFGANVSASLISIESDSILTALVTVDANAMPDVRNLALIIYDKSGKVIAQASKAACFTINASPESHALPDPQSILPKIGRSGVWNPLVDGDLPVQVKVPVAGSYNVMVGGTSGIKYKTVQNLKIGYNKIVIPSNLEFTNGAHVLILQDPRTGKTVKAKFAVNQ